MELKVHHIGYAVNNIEKSVVGFEAIGYRLTSPICDDNIRNVRICFMENNHTKIELVAPNGDNNPVDGVLKKSGVGPYHICYEVSSISNAIIELKKYGYIQIKKAEPAPAIGERNVAFLYNANAGMIELVEEKD